MCVPGPLCPPMPPLSPAHLTPAVRVSPECVRHFFRCYPGRIALPACRTRQPGTHRRGSRSGGPRRSCVGRGARSSSQIADFKNCCKSGDAHTLELLFELLLRHFWWIPENRPPGDRAVLRHRDCQLCFQSGFVENSPRGGRGHMRCLPLRACAGARARKRRAVVGLLRRAAGCHEPQELGTIAEQCCNT